MRSIGLVHTTPGPAPVHMLWLAVLPGGAREVGAVPSGDARRLLVDDDQVNWVTTQTGDGGLPVARRDATRSTTSLWLNGQRSEQASVGPSAEPGFKASPSELNAACLEYVPRYQCDRADVRARAVCHCAC
jgi:hypothetical protein